MHVGRQVTDVPGRRRVYGSHGGHVGVKWRSITGKTIFNRSTVTYFHWKQLINHQTVLVRIITAHLLKHTLTVANMS